MRIAKFVRTNTVDWENVDACAIHAAGCDFRCPYCNAKDCILYANEPVDEDSVLTYIEQNKDFLKGVIFTGGEPTINDSFRLMKKVKKLGMKICVFTNGYHPDELDDLIGAEYVDKVVMDIKAPLDNERYSEVAGIDIDVRIIKRSIRTILASDIDHEFTITCSPMHIRSEDIGPICAELKGAKNLTLRQFVPKNCLDPRMDFAQPYPKSILSEMGAEAKTYIRNVRVRL